MSQKIRKIKFSVLFIYHSLICPVLCHKKLEKNELCVLFIYHFHLPSFMSQKIRQKFIVSVPLPLSFCPVLSHKKIEKSICHIQYLHEHLWFQRPSTNSPYPDYQPKLLQWKYWIWHPKHVFSISCVFSVQETCFFVT